MRSVGPYVLEGTLGRGQTGMSWIYRCISWIFSGLRFTFVIYYFFYRAGETWSKLCNEEKSCC